MPTAQRVLVDRTCNAVDLRGRGRRKCRSRYAETAPDGVVYDPRIKERLGGIAEEGIQRDEPQLSACVAIDGEHIIVDGDDVVVGDRGGGDIRRKPARP